MRSLEILCTEREAELWYIAPENIGERTIKVEEEINITIADIEVLPEALDRINLYSISGSFVADTFARWPGSILEIKIQENCVQVAYRRWFIGRKSTSILLEKQTPRFRHPCNNKCLIQISRCVISQRIRYTHSSIKYFLRNRNARIHICAYVFPRVNLQS